MSMDRRDFIKFLALTMASGAALPQQVEAFEHLFFANAPKTPGSVIAVDEVMFSGLAGHSFPITLTVFKAGQRWMPIGCNLFGGIVRWVASPTQTIVAHPQEITWKITADDELKQQLINIGLSGYMTGWISFLAQDGLRHNHMIERTSGSLDKPTLQRVV